MTEPTPRETRSVSADGQWIVRLLWTPMVARSQWFIFHVSVPESRHGEPGQESKIIADTGQDAAQVLADWEKEQNDG